MTTLNFDEMDFDQARAVKEGLAQMLDSPGWAIVVQMIESRTDIRAKALYELCPQSVEEMCRFNRMRGQIEELQQLPLYVQQLFSDVTEEVRRVQDEMEEEQLVTEESTNEYEG